MQTHLCKWRQTYRLHTVCCNVCKAVSDIIFVQSFSAGVPQSLTDNEAHLHKLVCKLFMKISNSCLARNTRFVNWRRCERSAVKQLWTTWPLFYMLLSFAPAFSQMCADNHPIIRWCSRLWCEATKPFKHDLAHKHLSLSHVSLDTVVINDEDSNSHNPTLVSSLVLFDWESPSAWRKFLTANGPDMAACHTKLLKRPASPLCHFWPLLASLH